MTRRLIANKYSNFILGYNTFRTSKTGVTSSTWKMKICTNVNCHLERPSARKKYRKSVRRNLNRRRRRKRSILRYYSKLKDLRYQRKTDDLCSAITVVDIADMEWTPLVSSRTAEVAEWHKQEQIAYWKSRALSLEYENKMLIQHIRNVYAKQTEDYANYMKSQQHKPIEETPEKIEEIKPSLEEPIREQVGKRRREEMEKLYGKKATKIMGMETAVQLNYDLHLEDAGKLPHWPHTPLNLRFDD